MVWFLPVRRYFEKKTLLKIYFKNPLFSFYYKMFLASIKLKNKAFFQHNNINFAENLRRLNVSVIKKKYFFKMAAQKDASFWRSLGNK